MIIDLKQEIHQNWIFEEVEIAKIFPINRNHDPVKSSLGYSGSIKAQVMAYGWPYGKQNSEL